MASESLAKLNQVAGGGDNKSGQQTKKHHVLPIRGSSSNELRAGLLNRETTAVSASSKVSPASSTHTINSSSGTAQRVITLAQAIKPDNYVTRRDKSFRRNSSQLQLWLGRSHLPMLQAKFNSQDQSSEDGSTPLITKLDKYTQDELIEFRQVFNLFDTDRSGAIGLGKTYTFE